MRSSNPEPFLINAAANASSSTAATNQRRSSYVRRGDREQTTNADNSNSSTNAFNNDDRRNASGGALGNLRRRYQRRSNASNSEPDEEEGARIDNYSPPGKAEIPESNYDTLQQTKADGSDNNNVKELSRYSTTSRHSSLSTTQPAVDDITIKKAEERKTQHGDNNNIQLPIINQTNYIRKPDEKLREKFKNIIRSPADGIPEVHILGEISEGIGFKANKFISCKWYLEWGKAWSLLAGDEASQTQYAASSDDYDGVQEVVWNHPIDVHFATASMQGWPRIIVQLCELDDYGRSVLSGYGFTHLPTNPGYHELEIHCWRPSGSVIDELNAFFLGTSPCLADERIIFGKAWETRSKLNTVASGIVKLNVHVVLRFFNEQKVA